MLKSFSTLLLFTSKRCEITQTLRWGATPETKRIAFPLIDTAIFWRAPLGYWQ